MSKYKSRAAAANEALVLLEMREEGVKPLPGGWDQTLRTAIISVLHGLDRDATVRFGEANRSLLTFIANQT